MSSITAQQTKLDLELVPKENRLDIGKCNGRIPHGFSPREPTFQVTLDALALTPCYPAFLITADVPEVYMHQFWNCIYKHDDFYRFKIDKKKCFKLTLEVFRDILQICPRVQGRDFDPLPSEEDTMSFLRDLGHTGVINSLNDVVVDQMHQPWRTFAALINRSLSGKTTGLDKLRLSRAQIIWGMYFQKNIDYVELLWEDFTYQIDNKEFKKQDKMYYPRFTKVIIHHFLIQEKSLSWRNRIGMHTSKDDYLINTLRFVSRKEASRKYGVVLLECLTSPTMKESKAYKTYLGFATGAVPPKAARKFKKASPSKKDNVPIPEDEEPVKKGKILKTAAKKSAYKPATGIIIREPTVETKSKRKEKEKVDVAYGKGIELLSDVSLTKEAQIKEVRKKSLRDIHKTHPSGSGTVAEDPPSVAKITSPVISEGTGDIPGVPDVTDDDSSESESESWGNDEDDSNEEHVSSDEGSEEENESDKQALDSEQEEESEDDDQEENKDDDDLELESNDKIEGDEERDDTTDQFNDDADARLEEPTETATGIVQGEGTDAEMTESQQGNENLETTQEQVVEDAHVMISTVTKKTKVPVTSSSRSSDLASKFLNFLDIPYTNAEIVSPLDVPVHHEVPRTQAPTLLFTYPVSGYTMDSITRISALEKEVAELKKDPLHTQVTLLLDEHLDTRLGETREEFINFLSESFTARIKEQVKDQLPRILPQEVSNFAPPCKNYAGLEYDFEECYKALSESLMGKSVGGAILLILSTLPLITSGKLYYQDKGSGSYDYLALKTWLQTYGSPVKGMQFPKGDVYLTKRILAVTHVSVMRKYGYRRNGLMRSDELYKFSDGTLTRLLSSLEDINKNIDMTYLPKRRWSTLEKKRAHFMIKDINKLLKEKRMMRSLEKFVGGRLYGTDLRLLQRTI
ncbi:hypothetical protein Tco_0536771 [Tanacetum coccineum]